VDPSLGWEICAYDYQWAYKSNEGALPGPLKNRYGPFNTFGGLSFANTLNDVGAGTVSFFLGDDAVFPGGDTFLLDKEHYWVVYFHGEPMTCFMGEDVSEDWVNTNNLPMVTISGRSPIKFLEEIIVRAPNWPTWPRTPIVAGGYFAADWVVALLADYVATNPAPVGGAPPAAFNVPQILNAGTVGVLNPTYSPPEGTDMLSVLKALQGLGKMDFYWGMPYTGGSTLGQAGTSQQIGALWMLQQPPAGGTRPGGVQNTQHFYEGGQIVSFARNRSRRQTRTLLYGQNTSTGDYTYAVASGGYNKWGLRSGWLNDSTVDAAGLGAELATMNLATGDEVYSPTCSVLPEALVPATTGALVPMRPSVAVVDFDVGDNAVIHYDQNRQAHAGRITQIAVAVNTNGTATVDLSLNATAVDPASALAQYVARTNDAFRLQRPPFRVFNQGRR